MIIIVMTMMMMIKIVVAIVRMIIIKAVVIMSMITVLIINDNNNKEVRTMQVTSYSILFINYPYYHPDSYTNILKGEGEGCPIPRYHSNAPLLFYAYTDLAPLTESERGRGREGEGRGVSVNPYESTNVTFQKRNPFDRG